MDNNHNVGMKATESCTWDWVHAQVDSIAAQAEQRELPEAITGIPRGGLIPAILLAYKLDIPYITLEQAQELLPGRRRRILLVDDIADSGYTLLDANYFGFITATLAKRHTSKFNPDFIGCTISNDDWIIFPWESTDSQPIQDYLKNKK